MEKLNVNGIVIHIDRIEENDFISLTDIAKQNDEDEPRFAIRNWMTQQNTLRYLGVWEEMHNPNFKRAEFRTFKQDFFDKPFSITPERWIKNTNAIGIFSRRGRGGGTFAHKDIAINFCYYLNPEFQVYFIKAFQELMKREFDRNSLHWHVSKITDNIDEVRNLLDTIPGQIDARNRLKKLGEKSIDDEE